MLEQQVPAPADVGRQRRGDVDEPEDDSAGRSEPGRPELVTLSRGHVSRKAEVGVSSRVMLDAPRGATPADLPQLCTTPAATGYGVAPAGFPARISRSAAKFRVDSARFSDSSRSSADSSPRRVCGRARAACRYGRAACSRSQR